MPLSTNKIAKKVLAASLLLVVTLILTLIGFYFSWSQVHLRDWKGDVAIILLLPFAGVNRVFNGLFHSEQLSPSMYRLSVVFGCMGQVLYYYAIFTFVKQVANIVRRHPHS